MRPWMALAAGALTVATAGCGGPGKSPAAINRLDCPAAEGVLQRQSVAANGKACVYRTAHGAHVDLRLVPVEGGLPATLASLEQEVRAMLPVPAPAPAETSGDAGKAKPKGDEGDEDVEIHMPGLHISAKGEDADVTVGAMTVNASDDGAVVRWVRDVRMIGEATSREKRGVRALFIVAGPDGRGQTSAGYHAAGRKTGPLAAALVKWSADDDDGRLQDDVRRLVRRNGGA